MYVYVGMQSGSLIGVNPFAHSSSLAFLAEFYFWQNVIFEILSLSNELALKMTYSDALGKRM